MIISSQVFESYLQCPTKCWLRSRTEQPAGNASGNKRRRLIRFMHRFFRVFSEIIYVF
jgi:CRISPR/Cas system-associated exonuclease Cas4 (RecB family)